MKGFYRFIPLFLLIGQGAFGQTFSTQTSAKVIGRNDRLQVQYVADNGNVSKFQLPNFRGWVVLSGPNVASSQTNMNGIVTQQMIYSLTLVPKQTGRLVVPGASALLDNKPVRTNAVYVEVKNTDHVQGSQSPSAQPPASIFDQLTPQRSQFGSDQFLRPGENARDKVNQNIVVRAEANKRTAVVGEPVLITYKLYTRLRSQSKVVSQPSFTGATVVEMTNENPLPTRESLNGKMYNVYVVRRVQLIPLQEGALVVPEAAVENKVALYDASRTSYRDLYYSNPSLPFEEITVTAKSKPIQIEIKSLPPFPAVGSAQFSGAVGMYTISAAPVKKNVETNSTNYLVVVIVGEGNLQQMRAPIIQWPKQMEAFDPTVEGQDDKTFFPVRSRKAFTFPFVVNAPGQYTIPPISFTYFDAAAGKYITKQTVSLPLTVVKSAAKPTFSIANPATNDFENRLIIILGAGLIAVIIGLIWFKDRNKAVAPATAAMTPITPPIAIPEEDTSAQYLLQIRELWPQENTSLFYKQLCSNVHGFIQSKLHIAPSQLKDYMLKNEGPVYELERLQQLLDHCSIGMYTPVYSMDEAIQHRLQAIETLTRLEREIP